MALSGHLVNKNMHTCVWSGRRALWRLRQGIGQLSMGAECRAESTAAGIVPSASVDRLRARSPRRRPSADPRVRSTTLRRIRPIEASRQNPPRTVHRARTPRYGMPRQGRGVVCRAVRPAPPEPPGCTVRPERPWRERNQSRPPRVRIPAIGSIPWKKKWLGSRFTAAIGPRAACNRKNDDTL